MMNNDFPGFPKIGVRYAHLYEYGCMIHIKDHSFQFDNIAEFQLQDRSDM